MIQSLRRAESISAAVSKFLALWPYKHAWTDLVKIRLPKQMPSASDARFLATIWAIALAIEASLTDWHGHSVGQAARVEPASPGIWRILPRPWKWSYSTDIHP
jgi:hypothetical protein